MSERSPRRCREGVWSWLIVGVVALSLSACGQSSAGGPYAEGGEEQSRQTEAQTEANYLEIGGLKYQVQLSRVLNAADVEDRQYLVGLPAGADLNANETWFGVFMRVENDAGPPATSTDRFELVDSDGNRFRPLALDTSVNPFVYRATRLDTGQIQPSGSSAAGQGPIQGELLLFRLEYSTLQNRPLELRFRDVPTGQIGVVELDV
jgi:hypothetical protein